MISPSGKVEWLCPECHSKDIQLTRWRGSWMKIWACAVCEQWGQWRKQCEKLREICHHLRHCRECGETDVMNCHEGRVLWLDQFFEDGRSND